MAEVKIPEFLKYDANRKECKLSTLIEQYEARFGKTWATEPFDFTDEELEKIFETCLMDNRTFSDVIKIDFDDIDEDEEW